MTGEYLRKKYANRKGPAEAQKKLFQDESAVPPEGIRCTPRILVELKDGSTMWVTIEEMTRLAEAHQLKE